MKSFQQNLKKLEATNTQVLGVSMDSPFANKAFADSIGVTFPLLSDWGGALSRKYGVEMSVGPNYTASRRVTFLIDESGKIAAINVDKDAIDPTKIISACERKQHKPS